MLERESPIHGYRTPEARWCRNRPRARRESRASPACAANRGWPWPLPRRPRWERGPGWSDRSTHHRSCRDVLRRCHRWQRPGYRRALPIPPWRSRSSPRRGQWPCTLPNHRRPFWRTRPPPRARASRPPASSPTCGTPAITAIVAGIAPSTRTADSRARATSRLSGKGRPCAMIVDSRATTARPPASALPTSSEMCSTQTLYHRTVRFPLTDQLLVEAKRFQLRSACCHCLFYIESEKRCAHEWPDEGQSRWPLDAPDPDGSPPHRGRPVQRVRDAIAPAEAPRVPQRFLAVQSMSGWGSIGKPPGPTSRRISTYTRSPADSPAMSPASIACPRAARISANGPQIDVKWP